MKNLARKRRRQGLSAEARGWKKQLIEAFDITDEAGLLLLGTAMESFDLMREAQTILAAEGIICRDRFGQQRQHPATLVLRDAKTALLRSMKALNLDVEPPPADRGGRAHR